MEIVAISAGKIARKPKNATPPAMIGMLSALFSAHARLTICFQPRSGIWVGFSAWMPGSTCSLGASFGGRSASGCGCRAASSSAALAAARRGAFSSTRCLIRSTALSRWSVPVMTFPLRQERRVEERSASVAGPGSGQLGEPARAGAVDRGLGGGEDRSLERRGQDHLAHRVLALQRVGGFLLVRDPLPDLLEDDPGHGPGQDAADQPDGPVDDLGSLARH